MAGNAFIPGLSELGRIRLLTAIRYKRVTSNHYGLMLAGLTLPVMALSIWLGYFYPSLASSTSLIPLFALAAFVAFFPVTVSAVGISFTAILPVAVAALYLYGPLAAVVVQVGAIAVQTVARDFKAIRTDTSSAAWNLLHACTQHALAIGTPALVFAMLIDRKIVQPHSLVSLGILCVVSLASFYIQAALNTTLVSIKHRMRWDVVWYENYRWTLIGALLIAPLGFVTGAIIEQSVACGVLFLLLPLAAAQRGFDLHVRKLEVYRQSVDLLGRLMQEAHPYTHGHLHRVASWAKKIAARVGLPPSSMALIEDAAILHDIGKIAIDDRILNKLGSLDDHEWTAIKRHPDTGADVVAQVRYLERVSRWIRHHHERVDGLGYPMGLAGSSIPLESRIIAVVDAFDAMVGGPSNTEKRPYRKPLTYDEARAELKRCSGTQFDSTVVKGFLSVLDEEARLRRRSVERSTP